MATIVLINYGSIDREIEDLGISIDASSTVNITELYEASDIIDSRDLDYLVINGYLVVNNGIEDLTIAKGIKHINYQSELEGQIYTQIFSASRNNINTTNVYLRNGDSLLTNLSPFILPFDTELIAITASTASSETWTAEVRSGFILIPGASLSIVSDTSGTGSFNINLNEGDPIELYCNGSNIDRPRITVTFRRR